METQRKAVVNILHLEDDPDDAYLIQRALVSDRAGAQVFHVKNHTEFLQALKEGSFDAILADNGLPCFSALDALKIVRQYYSGIPVICVSGSADEKYIRTCLEAGATDYVSKDELWKLSAAVRRAIESKKTETRIVRS